ncbi:MAG: NAD-dependent deacylase [Armatimonadetes bacterium]|nr:NAD-dependent deacylase [Armatimonadota bacterium]
MDQRLGGQALIVVLTGAGISAESGLPTFRGPSGLWQRAGLRELAEADRLLRTPRLVWELIQALREYLADVHPNPAHFALAELEEVTWPRGTVAIVTQNVDGLHQAAGSRRVVELHGSASRFVCQVCGAVHTCLPLRLPELPPRCACGGIIRPDVVFFGEPLHPDIWQEAMALAERAAVFIVVGTSLEVEPAAVLPFVALEQGALVIEINLEPTVLTRSADFAFHGFASHLLPLITERLRRISQRPPKKIPVT